MSLELGLVIALAVMLVGLLGACVILALKNKWVKQLYETACQANKEATEQGMSGVVKKAYILQKVEDKANELHIPYKLIGGTIKALVQAIIEYEDTKKDKKEVK